MPGRDGTGPAGLGPMTGGGFGYCAGYVNPNPKRMTYNPGAMGRGRGRGYRNFYNATGLPGYARFSMGMPAWGNTGYSPIEASQFPEQNIDAKQEAEILKSQAEFLTAQLNDIQARLSSLEKQKETKKESEK
ncbi:MAG: hypothetical protein EHM20_15865 [Alphaproteobacteria bacterium]|nr:MAG: hypothetical protein EHM20_15865 [Alphaproteobacteria bacterium]